MIDLQQSGAGLAGYALLAAQAEALFAALQQAFQPNDPHLHRVVRA